MGGNVTLGSATLTIGRDNTNTAYAGVMSGTGSLTKEGTGILTLSSTNTYDGGTVINEGAIALSADANLGAIGSGLTLNGGSLQALDSFTSSRAVMLDAAGGTVNTNGYDLTVNAIISGIGNLTKSGLGTLILDAVNTYSGGTTVSAGILEGTTTSLQGAITNNATVSFNQATNGAYASVLSGTGTVIKSGLGTVTLSGANTYSGGTTVSAGTLEGTTTSLQGAITNNATVVFNQATDGTYADVISGTGAVTLTGGGNYIFSGANTYSGGTTISAGFFRRHHRQLAR